MPLSLLLRCEDITKTREYYRDILHFDVIKGSELSLSVVKFSALIIFTELDLWQQNFQMSGTVYISVPDVDHYFSEVKDAAEIAWTLQDTRYGTREFAVRDCNGYCVAFMQNENDIKFKYVAK